MIRSRASSTVKAEVSSFPDYDHKADKAGNELGNDCCVGCSGHAHIQFQDKEKVQADVDKGGGDERIERSLGIAYAPEY